jgi:C1A family cysteine protease
MRYGWLPDLPDVRDHLSPLAAAHVALPEIVDMRPEMPPVYDQGELGSCTGNACAAVLEYTRRAEGLPDFIPSRLMLYYGARVLEGTTAHDAGAQIRDVIKSAAKWGACPEPEWPYDIDRFADKPTPQAYADALKDRAIGYRRVPQDLDHIRSVLADGDPIIFGATLYEPFESPQVARTGIVPMPSGSVVGGHAIVIVGYDHPHRHFIVRNSWGASWGLSGYCLFPYDYLLNDHLADDFWRINLVTP